MLLKERHRLHKVAENAPVPRAYDPGASVVGAVHTFWWLQASDGTQYIISGGPSNSQGTDPGAGQTRHLDIWATKENANTGPDTPDATTAWDSGLSAAICNSAAQMLAAAKAFPNGSILYANLGPNSNTAAHLIATAGGLTPTPQRGRTVGMRAWLRPRSRRRRGPFGPDLADLDRATARLIDVPITGQAIHQMLKIRIPDDPTWKRLERELGQPQFFIGGVGFQNTVLCAEAMNLAVTISSAGGRIPLQQSHFPYGYSSTDCTNIGFDFSAGNGEHVSIEISTRSDEPTAFDIEVVSVWPEPIKDATVGALFQRDFDRIFRTVAAIGAVMLAAGISIIVIRRKRRRRSIAQARFAE